MDKLINELAQKSDGFTPESVQKMKKFIKKRVTEYASFFNVGQLQLLKAMEAKRKVTPVNYYDDSNFPSLDNIAVFKDEKTLRDAVGDEAFLCPACKGVSINPYECTSKKITTDIKDGKDRECNWKSYGLFRAEFSFTLLDQFLDEFQTDRIFTPVNFLTDGKLDPVKVNQFTVNDYKGL